MTSVYNIFFGIQKDQRGWEWEEDFQGADERKQEKVKADPNLPNIIYVSGSRWERFERISCLQDQHLRPEKFTNGSMSSAAVAMSQADRPSTVATTPYMLFIISSGCRRSAG